MSDIQLPTQAPAPAAQPSAEPAGAQIADPGPLGLGAFALTTFVLSVFNANLIADKSLEAVVLPLALWYGGTAQFLAGMWEFRKGNTFGALAFSSFGSFWLSFAAYVHFIAPKLPPEHAYKATGLFLLAWAIFTAYMTVAATRINAVVLAVFVALTVTFALLCAGELAREDTITHIGGWAGLVTAVFAWYGSFAGVTNATWKREALPTWSLAR